MVDVVPPSLRPEVVRRIEPRSAQFRKKNEPDWQELDDIVVAGTKRGLRALTEEQLLRLPVLYRHAVSSLLFAQQTALDRSLVDYLDSLVGRAYLVIYTSRGPKRAPVRELFAKEVPRAVRAMGHEIALSVALFLSGIAVSFSLVRSDSSWYASFVDPALAGGRTPYATTEFLRSTLYHEQSEGLASFASTLFQHNAGIGLLAFATGIAAGVPSALLLFQNGLMLGAMLALFAGRGLLFPLLGWLLPHGVPELSAIVLCGAAGLRIGRAILIPGARGTRVALAEAGRQGAIVVIGCVFLFFVAGGIEGILRQQITQDGARFFLASVLATGLASWLLLGGKATELADGMDWEVSTNGALDASIRRAGGDARVEFATPEGVAIHFQLASALERAFAFALDLVFSQLILWGLLLLLLLTVGVTGSEIVMAAAIVGLFFVRHGYFLFFETRNQGTTPAKRWFGLRVVSADGQRVPFVATLARNVTRDVAVFVPMVMAASPEQILGPVPHWLSYVGSAWLAVLCLLPFLTRSRQRAGDLIAGTLVVRVPRALLASDESIARRGARFAFSSEQLGHYGTHELETLATFLRELDATSMEAHKASVVAATIARKIGASERAAHTEPLAFLRDFYRAQRAELERSLILGRTFADKEEREKERTRRS